jgi:hypothetical protein
MRSLTTGIVIVLTLLSSCESERSRTEKLLNVTVNDFPLPQGVGGFDEVGTNAAEFRFTVVSQVSSGAGPKAWYDSTSSVYATAPDGSIWEAFCGHAGTEPDTDPRFDTRPDALTRPKIVQSYRGFVSTPNNTRQAYGTHLGYAYSPNDVFIGRRDGSTLKTTLFFRDVGSHTTAPHHLAIDDFGDAHLVVADVNIYDGNRLDLYWLTGSLTTGEWKSAWRIDHRGFTSSSHPWNGAWRDRVHLLWHWDTGETEDPAMGLYHVEKTATGFGKKTKIASGRTLGWSAALNPDNGELIVVVPTDQGVLLFSKQNDKPWSRPTPFPATFKNRPDSSLEIAPDGRFRLKLGFRDNFRQWLLTPER